MEQNASKNDRIKPKNIAEFIARSVIVRQHTRDEELHALKQFKLNHTCSECDYVFGDNHPVEKCIICENICCKHCSDWDGGDDFMCSNCIVVPCSKCNIPISRDDRDNINCKGCFSLISETNICKNCMIKRICPCGVEDLYCNDECYGIDAVDYDDCSKCGTPYTSESDSHGPENFCLLCAKNTKLTCYHVVREVREVYDNPVFEENNEIEDVNQMNQI